MNCSELNSIRKGEHLPFLEVIVLKKEKTKAAIYIRVSTQEQAMEGYSLDAQKRTLTDYCRSMHYEIHGIYSDEGISAKDIEHRPGIMALIKDATDNKFDIILVWKLTRFSRNLANIVTVCEQLDKAGVTLVSYTEAFDSNTPSGRMIRSILGTVAQFEREIISENVKLGMSERAKQGKRTCSTVLGFDKDGKDSFVVNEKEAEYVRFCYKEFLKRKNVSEVASLARENGYSGKRGRKPSPASVMVILTRPIYAGYNVFHGKLYKGFYQPIISVKDFNKVQRIISRQGKLYGRERKQKLYFLPENTKSFK